MRLKRWVKVVITLLVIHLSFFIWKQAGVLGETVTTNKISLVLCVLSWIYLVIGQMLIYEKIWK